MKLINSGLFFANLANGASALRFAQGIGLDAGAAGRILRNGTGSSAAFAMFGRP